MIRKFVFISIFTLLLQTNMVAAGTTGSEELKGSGSQDTASECFEGFSRAMFKFNHALDGAIFEPVAKGYRALPVVIRQGTRLIFCLFLMILVSSIDINRIR